MYSNLEQSKVFQEMVTTEKTYNSSLKFLFLSLSVQLLFSEYNYFRELYNHIEQLNQLSDKLLSNVNISLKNLENQETRQLLKSERSSLFIQFFELYKSYSLLLKKYDDEIKANLKAFEQIDFYMINNSKKKLGFYAHLIMPIQRGPRYELLIKEIQKQNTGDDVNKGEFSTLQQMFTDQLSEFSSKEKSEPKRKSSDTEKRSYQFGDYTRYYLFGEQNIGPAQEVVLDKANEKSPEIKTDSSESSGYHFGDYTRSLISWATTPSTNANKTQSTTASKTNESKQESAQDNIEGFTLI